MTPGLRKRGCTGGTKSARNRSGTRQGAISSRLHTRVADHPDLLSQVGIDSPIQIVTVAKHIALPTLARDELFAYLTVHGASSAWFRLKWITDLAALLAR